jgi:hypothetical protein
LKVYGVTRFGDAVEESMVVLVGTYFNRKRELWLTNSLRDTSKLVHILMCWNAAGGSHQKKKIIKKKFTFCNAYGNCGLSHVTLRTPYRSGNPLAPKHSYELKNLYSVPAPNNKV